MLLPWALLAGVPVRAQQTSAAGSIRGRVVDRGTGKPLAFANVVVLGTTMSAVARQGGGFVIQHVPVGVCQVKASFVGYEAQTTYVRVQADKATLLEFFLREGDVVSLAAYRSDTDRGCRNEVFPIPRSELLREAQALP